MAIVKNDYSFCSLPSAISTFHPRPSSLFIASGSPGEGGRRARSAGDRNHHCRRHGRDRMDDGAAAAFAANLQEEQRSWFDRRSESDAAVTNFVHDNYLLTYGREKQSLRRPRRFMETGGAAKSSREDGKVKRGNSPSSRTMTLSTRGRKRESNKGRIFAIIWRGERN